jgi:hypothetical protein
MEADERKIDVQNLRIDHFDVGHTIGFQLNEGGIA